MRFLLRWWRVGVRLMRLGAHVRDVVMRIMALLAGLLGIGTIAGIVYGWGRVLRWLVADDWTHLGFVAVAAALCLALIALYAREKEDDDLKSKGVATVIEAFEAEILPLYEYSQAHVFEDVLALDVRIGAQNNSPFPVRLSVSSAKIQYKRGRSRELQPADLGPGFSPFDFLFGSLVHGMSPGHLQLRIKTRMPGGASSHARAPLRVLITLNIPGQGADRLTRDFTVEPAKPPADPGPPKASGQAPPSSPESSG